jgi:hypothetical protein
VGDVLEIAGLDVANGTVLSVVAEAAPGGVSFSMKARVRVRIRSSRGTADQPQAHVLVKGLYSFARQGNKRYEGLKPGTERNQDVKGWVAVAATVASREGMTV